MTESADEHHIEIVFLRIMDEIRSLPTQGRLAVINWAYEAIDERNGPLSGTDLPPPLPDVVYGVMHAGTIIKQRFTSQQSAADWATHNYKGRTFEVVQISSLQAAKAAVGEQLSGER